ncbi:hypothetical protein FIBSPDRAFT_877068 [Athelia psychrophila]|uniref:Uncharacterized protein n=1 Tax=Athelia psychrophila TaxID=1759441 RepID=A0A167W9U6_9AGAM|nr:hypothetical protein FIBSPDRAFT_877068 [Fibularhizoctonia sp. CBS 109695]
MSVCGGRPFNVDIERLHTGTINLGEEAHVIKSVIIRAEASTRPPTFFDINSDRPTDQSCEPRRPDISIRNNRPPPCPHLYLSFPHTPSSFWTIP